MSTQYNTAQLREKMIAAFSSHDLKSDIIFDHFPYELYADIEGMTSSREIIQRLFVYCKQHGNFPKLIKLLKEQRPNIFSEETDENENLRQLEEFVITRTQNLTWELNNTERQLEDIQNFIQKLNTEHKGIQRQIDNLNIDNNTPALTVLPLYDSLSKINLRIDSLIATREEMKRTVRRLRSEISDVKEQLAIVHKMRT